MLIHLVKMNQIATEKPVSQVFTFNLRLTLRINLQIITKPHRLFNESFSNDMFLNNDIVLNLNVYITQNGIKVLLYK